MLFALGSQMPVAIGSIKIQTSRVDQAVISASPETLLGHLTEAERKNAPGILFYQGDGSLFRAAPRVAIVGSRKASQEGLRRAAKLARALAKHGVIVVSGMAEGIDTAAHRAAMDAGGRTIAVLGSPLSTPYPAANRELFRTIIAAHLAVSQFRDGQPIQPQNFPIRNRTMALITHATVIVEAAEKSGTMHQAWEALRLGRPLFLLDSVANDHSLTWPSEVRKYGAQILAESNFEAMVDHLPAGELEEAVAF
ncbi:MAG: DNA-processing protein DprA [Rudaea sp.]|nr:DNA-processing protein DprA [Rudaea sp.]